MTNILENANIQFTLDAQRSCWSLQSLEGVFALADVRMRVEYRCQRARHRTLRHWDVQGISEAAEVPSPHGPMHQTSLSLAPDENGLRCGMDFALPDGYPLLLWRLNVQNDGPRPVRLDRLT